MDTQDDREYFMMVGIGIDAVEIERFAHWAQLPQKSLERIFSPQEIVYCLDCPTKSAERFAARFAAREALFKALHSAYQSQKMPFLTLCRSVIIEKTPHGAPILSLTTSELPAPLIVHLSWTHTQNTATAIILLQNA